MTDPVYGQNCPFMYRTDEDQIILLDEFGMRFHDKTVDQVLAPRLSHLATVVALAAVAADLTTLQSAVASLPAPAWTAVTGKPAFAAVATSGSYADLSDRPSLGTSAGMNVAITGNAASDQVVRGSDTRLSDARTPTSHTHTMGEVTGLSAALSGKAGAPAQSAVSRSLNAAFQVHATRPALVGYSVQSTITASIAGGQEAEVYLEICSDSGFASGVQVIDVAVWSQTYTLAVALQGVQKCTSRVGGVVPAGWHARIRTANVTGSPAHSYRAGQETLL